jgi:hypothetical protein
MDSSPLHDVSLWLLQTAAAAAIGAGVTLLTEHFKKTFFSTKTFGISSRFLVTASAIVTAEVLGISTVC